MGSAARPLRWAGPPPLLILATIAAFLLLPFISDAGSTPPARGDAQAELVGTTTAPDRQERRPDREPPTEPEADARPKPRKPEPEPRPVVIGVASANQWAQLPVDQIRADALALVARDDIDVIGWQEADRSRSIFAAIKGRGWDTRQFSGAAGSLAVSWRRAEFELVSADSRRVAYGVDYTMGQYPFPPRFVQRVTLRHRPSGELLTVINTHLPHKIEDLDRPGEWLGTSNAARARFQLARMKRDWRKAPGRWTVGTGDYNFDARSDARARPHDGVRDALGEYAVSSYAALGLDGLAASHPPTGRYIDYVHAARGALHRGEMEFVRHRMIGGLHTDHNAVLARIRLR